MRYCQPVAGPEGTKLAACARAIDDPQQGCVERAAQQWSRTHP